MRLYIGTIVSFFIVIYLFCLISTVTRDFYKSMLCLGEACYGPQHNCRSSHGLWSTECRNLFRKLQSRGNEQRTLNRRNNQSIHRHPVLSLFPSFSLPDVLCDPTDLIWRKVTSFEATTGRTASSSDCLLAEVFRGFQIGRASCRERV